jgi:hypothetical protein
MRMNWKAPKRWAVIVLAAVSLPVAAAATVSLTSGTLGSGSAVPATCDSGTPGILQSVGSSSPNTTNIVTVDVSGIVSACGGGTLKVSLYNAVDTVQEATATIPAGGGTVTVTFGTPVALKESHLVAVSLQGP